MKLYRGSPQDRQDLVQIWRRCLFENAEDAVRRFEESYPHLAPDPHLSHFVLGIALEVGQRLGRDRRNSLD